MKKYLVFVFIISFVLVSCGPGKNALGDAGLKNATARKVIRNYSKSEPNFKTLNARLRGTYNDGYEKQSITVSMRMKKDETIWISAKLAGLIPLAKLLITPDRVQFYEKINNQYFDGDFSLLSHWLGMEVDFQKAQNLLLGQALYPLDKNQYYLQDTDDAYVLNSNDNQILDKLFKLDKKNFRIRSQQFHHSGWSEKDLEVNYSSYKSYNNFLFPEKIDIIVNDKGQETEINIDYRSLDFNKSVKFPFQMPSGYKEIQL